jgi:hypothetical protein
MNWGGIPYGDDSHIGIYTGVLDGNTIHGDFSGSVYTWPSHGDVLVTWAGTFTVTIRKE